MQWDVKDKSESKMFLVAYYFQSVADQKWCFKRKIFMPFSKLSVRLSNVGYIAASSVGYKIRSIDGRRGIIPCKS